MKGILMMNFRIRATAGVLTACAALTLVTACSKSGGSGNAQASPAASMVYSGSTDTSTGGAAATPASDAASGGKAIVGDATHGKQIFTQNCAQCHGADGTQGGVGPSLKDEKSKKDTAAAVAWIKNPQPPMPKLYPSPLDEKDVADVAAYVESL
jgi:mono/diheme cytochrome c family protein